jgi:hypothetical protein
LIAAEAGAELAGATLSPGLAGALGAPEVTAWPQAANTIAATPKSVPIRKRIIDTSSY